MLAVKTVFWACGLLIFWVYAGYPLSLALFARFRSSRRRTGSELPAVTMIVSAYNEAAVIRAKLENCLELDYPAERLQILVISDASDDGTDEIVREFEHRGVVLRRQEPRGGKSRGLTRFVPEATGTVIVFSDANSMYDRKAIRHLVRHFADPEVGYVVGHQRYVEEAGSEAAESEGLYWRYEIALKRWESAVGSLVGGDGAIYAVRSELFFPLRDDDISDFVNPLQVVRAGYVGLFDPQAVCYERAASTYAGEFRRKVRIVNRSIRGLFRVPHVLDPRRVGWFTYEVVFHKLLRWFVPYLLLALLSANVALVLAWEGTAYVLGLAAQLTLYGLAALGARQGTTGSKLLSVPFYFCLVNAASLLGTLGVLLGKRYATWKPERMSGS